MSLTRLAAMAFLVVAALARPAAAAPKVTDFTLENGMQVVVIEDHRSPVVTHMVWYRVGAADEPWGHSGIAHFLEHLMFKGTDKLKAGEFSQIVAQNGGTENAFTGQDFTAYFQHIAADRLDPVMGMEADRMSHLKLTQDVVKTERSVILEERSQRIDNNPQALFSEQLSAALYQNSPYGIPVIGWRHEMEKLSLEDEEKFYQRYYAPDNAILVVAGDVMPDQVRKLAEKNYGPIAPSGRLPAARPQEPPHRAPVRVVMRDARVRQPVVERLYLVPTYDPKNPQEAAALELLSDLLGRGITSRLSRTLEVEKKLAIETGASYSAVRRDPHAFGIYAVPAQGHTLAEVEHGIDSVISEFASKGPTADELDRAKRLVRAALIYDQDNQAALAHRYGAALAVGQTVEDVQNWPKVLESVTAEQVRAVAAKYLVPDRSATGWLKGKGEKGS